jgi:predicted adenylyl cyclase CyaB
MSNQYEIEIKTLLGSKENALALVDRMKQKDSSFKALGLHKQLNHYFDGGDITELYQNIKTYLNPEKAEALKKLSDNVKDFSVRTRQADTKVIFVIKASVDDTTSSNGTARMEFESQVNLSLEELDKILLNSGFKYQAKWSREREEYEYKGLNVTVDKNAGYGYLAEFELVGEDASKADEMKKQLREVMNELEVEELNQERLARMFDYYNHNWQDYYGTDKVFNIE